MSTLSYPLQNLSFRHICRREKGGLEWFTYSENNINQCEETPKIEISGASSRSLVMKMLIYIKDFIERHLTDMPLSHIAVLFPFDDVSISKKCV